MDLLSLGPGALLGKTHRNTGACYMLMKFHEISVIFFGGSEIPVFVRKPHGFRLTGTPQRCPQKRRASVVPASTLGSLVPCRASSSVVEGYYLGIDR